MPNNNSLNERHQSLPEDSRDRNTIWRFNSLEVRSPHRTTGSGPPKSACNQKHRQQSSLLTQGKIKVSPIQTPPACCMWQRTPWTAAIQASLLPSPVSPINPFFQFCWSCSKLLGTNSGRFTGLGRSGGTGVEVLMHLCHCLAL